MFINGQKVVCVDDTFGPIARFYTALPVKDKVYVVRGLAPAVEFIAGKKEESIAVYLEGLVNPCSNTPPNRERGFSCNRFVPLEELTEDQILALSKPATVTA